MLTFQKQFYISYSLSREKWHVRAFSAMERFSPISKHKPVTTIQYRSHCNQGYARCTERIQQFMDRRDFLCVIFSLNAIPWTNPGRVGYFRMLQDAWELNTYFCTYTRTRGDHDPRSKQFTLGI